MTKKIPAITAITATALLLIGVIAHQSGTISDLRRLLSDSNSKLIEARNEKEEALAANVSLQSQVSTLKDSIAVLNLEIEALGTRIEEQDAVIKELDRSIQQQADRIGQLTKEINRLRESVSNNNNKIKDLEAERLRLLDEVQLVDQLRSELKTMKERDQALQKSKEEKQEQMNAGPVSPTETADPQPVVLPSPEVSINQPPGKKPAPNTQIIPNDMEATIRTKQQEELKNVLTKTTVKFSEIALKQKEGGHDLRKIKADGWKYAFIDLDLDNLDPDALINKFFLLQVYDLDNQVVVPYNERNPNFPESDQGAAGFLFRYEGKPISIRYINTQKKESDNYEIRLLHVRNDITFPIVNGKKTIVSAGEVVVR